MLYPVVVCVFVHTLYCRSSASPYVLSDLLLAPALKFYFLSPFTVLQRLLGGDNPPNKVVEIKSESLGTLQVVARDDAMVLFAPPYNSNDKRAVYEIILQRPTSDSNTSSFSLYRSPVQQEAEEKFNTFMQRLPVFVGIVKEVSHLAYSDSNQF